MKKHRYGYKGVETALNGLTFWLENHFDLKGSASKRYEACCLIIIQYGIEHLPKFKKKGRIPNCADFVAKSVSLTNKFNHFTDWVRKTFPKQITITN